MQMAVIEARRLNNPLIVLDRHKVLLKVRNPLGAGCGGGNENRPVAKRASDDGSSRVDAVSRSRHRPTFQSFRSRSRSYLLETWFALSQPTSVSVTSRRPYLQSQASAFLW